MNSARRMLGQLVPVGIFLVAACSNSDEGQQASPAGTEWGAECETEYAGKFSYDVSAPESSCVELINRYRAEMGQPKLARWKEGESCAAREAEADATAAGAHGSFGDCGEMAQNTCPGWDSVESVLGGCLVNMFCEGPSANGEWDMAHGHHMNMVAEGYTQVACGFYQMSDGSYWVNMNFK